MKKKKENRKYRVRGDFNGKWIPEEKVKNKWVRLIRNTFGLYSDIYDKQEAINFVKRVKDGDEKRNNFKEEIIEIK